MVSLGIAVGLWSHVNTKAQHTYPNLSLDIGFNMAAAMCGVLLLIAGLVVSLVREGTSYYNYSELCAEKSAVVLLI